MCEKFFSLPDSLLLQFSADGEEKTERSKNLKDTKGRF